MKGSTRCLYEVLGVQVGTSDATELKKAYRREALKWHPDKHMDKPPSEAEEAQQRFLEVQEAWRVLSDPNERAWYDDHRADILRGAGGGSGISSEDGQPSDGGLPNLWPFFSPACFSGFGDDEKGFYAVYAAVFEQIWAAEPHERRDEASCPSFGDSSTPWPKVKAFYGFWTNFQTQSLFGWADKWRVPDGESRDVRRQMKKENDKARMSEKKKWVETVRKLVGFARGMDKRVLVEQQRSLAEAERARQEGAERAKERKREQAEKRAQRAAELVEDEETQRIEQEFWKRWEQNNKEMWEGMSDDVGNINNDNMNEEEQQQNEEDEEPFCAVCRKPFKSLGSLQSHQNSKKHREEVARVRKELLMAGEKIEGDVEALLTVSSLADQQRSGAGSGSKSKKKKGKKGKKNNADDDEEEQQEQEQGERGEDDNNNNNNNNNENDNVEDVAQEQEEVVNVSESAPSASAGAPTAKTKKKRRANKKDGANANANRCAECGEAFDTRTKLFKHLKDMGHAKPM